MHRLCWVQKNIGHSRAASEAAGILSEFQALQSQIETASHYCNTNPAMAKTNPADMNQAERCALVVDV